MKRALRLQADREVDQAVRVPREAAEGQAWIAASDGILLPARLTFMAKALRHGPVLLVAEFQNRTGEQAGTPFRIKR